jgi:nitroimidazol reductase NimA-like FMN-containing flavoprotein (pyridoxamine 5'-phosphate oxidase superfamily)
MKTHQLSKIQIQHLLERSQAGCLATLNPNGTPYITPIHFIYLENAIFAHGLPKGKKLDNIASNPQVGFCVYEVDKLLLDPEGKPCDTNTKYESVIISGVAKPVDDIKEKGRILKEIVKKYTPQLAKNEIPDNMVKSTAVIRIDVTEITGKYYS